MLWHFRGEAAQPGSAGLAESPRSPWGAAVLGDRSERWWESPGEYGWVAGWLVEKYLDQAQEKERLRLAGPEA